MQTLFCQHRHPRKLLVYLDFLLLRGGWSGSIHLVVNAGAGWSSLVARRAHNPKVVGSNPTPATNIIYLRQSPDFGVIIIG